MSKTVFQQPEEQRSSSSQTPEAKSKSQGQQDSRKKAVSKKKQKGIFLKVVLSLMALSCLSFYGWYVFEQYKTSSDLNALKAKGIPTSVEEYVKTIPHEGRDGSTQYMAAMNAWDAVPQSDQQLIGDPFQDTWLDIKEPTAPQASRYEQLIASDTTFWRQAATTDWCDFAAKEGRPPLTAKDALRGRDLQVGIQFLVASAQHMDPYDRAFTEIYYASRISGNMSRGALGMAEENNALRADERVMKGWQETLARGADNPRTVSAAERSLTNMPPLPSLDRMMRSIFVGESWLYDNYRQMGSIDPNSMPQPKNAMDELQMGAMNSKIGMGVQKRYFVKQWRYAFDHFPSNPEDWKGYQDALRLAVQYNRMPDWMPNVNSIDFLPDFIGLRMERVADRRIAKCALAVLEQRLQTGSLPSTLPNLGIDSIDPFTRKPFIYKQVKMAVYPNPGFTIYSVGRDGLDNGGTPQDHQKTDGYDIVQSYY